MKNEARRSFLKGAAATLAASTVTAQAATGEKKPAPL